MCLTGPFTACTDVHVSQVYVKLYLFIIALRWQV